MRKMKQTGKTYGIAPLRAFLSVLLVLTMVFSAAMPNGLGAWKAYAAAGELPDHAKILQQNPDGTYTIALNVKGDADKVPQKVNVLVIVDRSGSMTRDSGQELITYTPNNNNGNNRYGTLKSDPDIHNDDDFFPLTRYNSGGVNVYTYPSPGSVAYTPGTNNNHNYGLVNGEYVQLTYTDNWGRRTWYANGQVYTGTRYRRRTDVAAYDGQRYIRSANQSRMAATQEAVNALAESLFRHNDEENPDVVEMALVSFATTASTAHAKRAG